MDSKGNNSASIASTPVPRSPFPTILNFRDIESFEKVSSSEVPEHIQQGKKHDAKVRELASEAEPESPIAPTKVPGICYRDISLNGRSYEKKLLKRLRYASLALIALMALGHRTEAIKILGKEVIQPRGLVGQATDAIDSSGLELKQVLSLLADAENYPVYFHCTSGKDRTGLVALILLMILDVPCDIISVDYMASEGELLSERKFRIQELQAMGLSDDFANCPPRWVMDVHEHIIRTYGNFQSYLDRIGVDEALRHGIRSNILE
ncbi:MAG: hypothetical protein Q9182_000669 [Xanthomendoza sp. 2 TL-2023]